MQSSYTQFINAGIPENVIYFFNFLSHPQTPQLNLQRQLFELVLLSNTVLLSCIDTVACAVLCIYCVFLVHFVSYWCVFCKFPCCGTKDYLIAFHLILSHLITSHHISSYLILSHLIFSYLILSHLCSMLQYIKNCRSVLKKSISFQCISIRHDHP